MIILPAQFDGHRGPDVVGQHKIVFTVDESVDISDFNPMKIKKGTQYFLVLLDMNEPNDEKNIHIQVKEKMNKKLHALMSELAELKGMSMDVLKTELKNEFNVEHTNEMSLKQYAQILNRVESEINSKLE